MERSLVVSALAVGCAGALASWLVLRARGRAATPLTVPYPFLVFAGVLPLLVFAATLPSHGYWSAGHGLGWGVLLGGIGALAAGWQVLRGAGQADDAVSRTATLAGAQFVAVVAVAIPVLLMHGVVVDAVCGAAIGWLAVSLILSAGLASAAPDDRQPQLALALGVIFAACVSAAVLLGVHRDATSPMTERGPWAASVLMVGATVPLLSLLAVVPAAVVGRVALRLPGGGWVGGLVSRASPSAVAQDAVAGAARFVVAAVLLLVLAWLLALRVVGDRHLVGAVVAGVAVGLVVRWLLAEAGSTEGGADTAAGATDSRVPPLAVFVVLAGFMVAGQLLQGTGVGLMALAAWLGAAGALPPAVPAKAGGRGTATVYVLGIGTLLTLYRLFGARYADDLHGVVLSDSYALFGFLVGAVAPSLLVEVVWRRGRDGAPAVAPGISRLLAAGAVLLALPGAIVLLWGAKCSLALVAGLALACALPGAARSLPPAARLWHGLVAIGISLALVQWMGRVLPLFELTRGDKIRILTWAAGIVILLLLAADYGGRLRGRLGTARRSPGAPADGAVP